MVKDKRADPAKRLLERERETETEREREKVGGIKRKILFVCFTFEPPLSTPPTHPLDSARVRVRRLSKRCLLDTHTFIF